MEKPEAIEIRHHRLEVCIKTLPLYDVREQDLPVILDKNLIKPSKSILCFET